MGESHRDKSLCPSTHPRAGAFAIVVADPCVGQILAIHDHRGVANRDPTKDRDAVPKGTTVSLPGRANLDKVQNLVKVEQTTRAGDSAGRKNNEVDGGEAEWLILPTKS
jgi:hypothetical protein